MQFKIKPTAERFYNSNSNWGVYVFQTNDDIPHYEEGYDFDPFDTNPYSRSNAVKIGTLCGNMQKLTIGVTYNVTAEVEYNKKYKSWQYQPSMITSVVPKTHDEQVAYLKTQVTGLQAKNILEIYPNVVDDVMNGKDIDYSVIHGIGEYTWNKIKKSIIDNYAMSDLLVYLQPMGITFKMLSKLLDTEPNPVLLQKKIKDDPYVLTKIKGLGFKTVDAMALKLNPEIKVSQKRVVAFLNYYFTELGESTGNTLVNKTVIDNIISNDYPECAEIYNDLIEHEKTGGLFLCIIGNDIGLARYHNAEMGVYNLLQSIDSTDSSGKFDIDIDKGIETAEKEQGFEFSDEQKECINSICQHNVNLLTGVAGTGKSTVLRAITEIYKGYSIACCALSAKAAQRIIEATGHEAMTIHRLLQFNPNFGWGFNAGNPLPCDVLILDEASMANIPLFKALLSAVSLGTKVILCGDDGQLPPIGYGNLFHDLLEYNQFHSFKLQQIHRQAAKSGIITDAAKIRNNENPLDKPATKVVTGELQDMTYMFRDNREGMRNLAVKLFLKAIEQDGVENTIIITPCKQDRINSTFEINKIIQDKLFPSPKKSIKIGVKEFRVGDRIIQTVNDYEINVMNGETGYVTDIVDNNTMMVRFDNKSEMMYSRDNFKNIELAYAMTIHKCQGSGYKNVICIIDNTHYKLLDSCLLYTGLTRAIKKCLLIAEPSAFRQCIRNKASDRNTWLKKFFDIF